jgi:hypothetical protein
MIHDCVAVEHTCKSLQEGCAANQGEPVGIRHRCSSYRPFHPGLAC